MKWTAKRIIFVILQFAFYFVAPLILIWTQYAEQTTVSSQYKLTVSGLIVLICVFMVFKKVWLNGKISALQAKANNMETQALTTTDQKAIKKLKSAYKVNSVLLMIINLIVPLCVFGISILTCKALEEQVLKLYGVLVLIAASYGIGYIFKILEIVTITLPHEEKKR